MDKFFECDCPRCKPEIYIINKDERIKELEQDLARYKSSYLFTQHIKEHLKDGEYVICKICGKALKEFEEAKE